MIWWIYLELFGYHLHINGIPWLSTTSNCGAPPSTGYTNRADSPAAPAAPPAAPQVPPAASPAPTRRARRRSRPAATPRRRPRLPPRAGSPDGKGGNSWGKTAEKLQKKHHLGKTISPTPPKKSKIYNLYIFILYIG